MKSLSFRILMASLGLILLVYVGLGIFLSQDKVLEERHQPFPYDTFDFETETFESFIHFSQEQIRAARVASSSQQYIQNASPFILEPAPQCALSTEQTVSKGIVLNHGLIASPYSMIDIGQYFQSRCFYVFGVLLPDHVTRPGDFINTHWEDWALLQQFAISELDKRVDEVYLSGHSAGATLALYEAAVNPEIKGLILFTPALQITGAAKYAKFIRPIGTLFPKASWFEVRDDEADYRYESITFAAADETYQLIQATKAALTKGSLNIPVMTIASEQDNTVNTSATMTFMDQLSHRQSRTLLYSQQLDSANHRYRNDPKVELFDSYAPDHGVLSISHLGIMLPSSHQEYGVEGNYRNCGHYFGQGNDKWELCKAGNRDFYGEVTFENLQQGLIERIAFNPFYEDMLMSIDAFLQAL